MHHILLANGADSFFSSGLGSAIQALMQAAAVIIVIAAAIKSIKHVMEGKTGKALQMVLGAIVIVVFLWDPTLIGSLIETAKGLFSKGSTSIDKVTTTR